MNTAQLKSDFHQTYKYFFNKYDLVISSPIQFILVGETSLFSEGKGSLLSQKIPLRNYIGINFNSPSSKSVEFIYKTNVESVFKTSVIENFYPLNREILDKIGLNYEIGFLSEYNWMDPSSIITNILTSILLINEKLKIEDLERTSINDLTHKELVSRVIDLDKELLKKFNFFGPHRNNSNFIGSCFLYSGSQILVIEHEKGVKYLNVGANVNYTDVDLGITIINPNSIVKNNYKTKLLLEQLDGLNKFVSENGINLKINLFEGIEEISCFYALKTFKNLKNLYNQNGTEFFDDIMCYRNILKQIFKNYSSGSIDVLSIKNEILNYIGNRNMNLYIDQIGASMDARLVMLSDKFLNIDNNLIKDLNEDNGFNFTIDYSSFYDGFEFDGTKVEQFKSKKKFSEFTSGNLLIQFNKERLYNSTIDYSDAINNKNNDILLDLIENKIYINGEKLTSNEIVSQSMTIELLSILIEKSGEDISNKVLSSSSYSKNKNEMLGKIVTPLVRLIKNKLGKDLPLICKGSLNDFYIKLNSTDITISVLKKIV